jgi:hypothetical protein
VSRYIYISEKYYGSKGVYFCVDYILFIDDYGACIDVAILLPHLLSSDGNDDAGDGQLLVHNQQRQADSGRSGSGGAPSTRSGG